MKVTPQSIWIHCNIVLDCKQRLKCDQEEKLFGGFTIKICTLWQDSTSLASIVDSGTEYNQYYNCQLHLYLVLSLVKN